MSLDHSSFICWLVPLLLEVHPYAQPNDLHCYQTLFWAVIGEVVVLVGLNDEHAEIRFVTIREWEQVYMGYIWLLGKFCRHVQFLHENADFTQTQLKATLIDINSAFKDSFPFFSGKASICIAWGQNGTSVGKLVFYLTNTKNLRLQFLMTCSWEFH